MRYVVIGCGNVGGGVARLLRAQGHEVVGTTTSEERRAEVAETCGEAVVLSGRDVAAVRRVAEGADGLVLTVSPRLRRALDPASRAAEYADALVATARAAASAHPRVVMAGSVSVYGDAAGPVVDETTAPTEDDDASPRSFLAAEAAVLALDGGAVVRLPDVTGHPGDLDDTARVKLAHDHLGGVVPFASGALRHRIDHRDAAGALAFVLTQGLTGLYNAVPDATVPPTNAESFGKVCAAAGLPPLTFAGQIRTPAHPISSALLRGAGFTFQHS
ncbi:NAD(P)-binding domain-containing protein [Streptomyces sp. NPDC052052]|uniref:NAD-dependent epimerase/dehydratase family protein n=1 Tax=Streptomyces sp. NPDC052052 TaxID=3154756 RepID=UPI00343053C8